MGASESKPSDTINWNNVKTNEFSSNIANIKNISHNKKKLFLCVNYLHLLDKKILIELNNKNIKYEIFFPNQFISLDKKYL